VTRVVTAGETMALLDPQHGLLQGRPPAEAARVGHTIAACALRGTGDWETLPRLGEVNL
jgi:sugar/nucleoside kinase (ribokinase family)